MTTPQHNTTPKKRWPKWAKAFLNELSSYGNVRRAADAAGIERSTAYDLKHADETFAAAWQSALDQAADILEEEARRRAVEGWDEPVFGSMGAKMGSGQIGVVRKYSDTLLIFLMKGANPEKYRDRQQIEHTGAAGGPLQFSWSAAIAEIEAGSTEDPNASG